MTAAQVLVLALTTGLAGALVWYFFGPKPAAQQASRTDGRQDVTVVIRGGYTPARIQAVAGVPLRITFDRQEAGDCTSRVVMPDLGINQALPANHKTVVELVPPAAGEFGFSCAMNMIHGTLLVSEPSEPAAVPAPPGAVAASDRSVPDPAAQEAAEVQARQDEIRDLNRRVGLGAVLTAPVLFAVMAHSVFGVTWEPDLLLNRWWQLLLITPVMVWTGAPVHRTGWLALSTPLAVAGGLVGASMLASSWGLVAVGFGYLLAYALLVVGTTAVQRHVAEHPW